MAPYCDKDAWAKRRSSDTQTYDNWSDYDTAEQWPDANSLDEALQDATDIMNDSEHLNVKTSNVTNASYTNRLERLCYDITNRLLGVEGNQAMQGGIWTYSPQDKMNTMERNFLRTTSKVLNKRPVGKVVF